MQTPGEKEKEKKETPTEVAFPEPRAPSRYLMTQKGYLHPMKTYVWVTLFVTGLMTALWFVVGIGPGAQGTIPPAFVLGASDIYFHSIAIGLAALLVIFVVTAFGIDKYEPSVDFPIAYRATLATIVGAVGGFLYLRPVFHTWFAPLPLVVMFIALLLLADVGGALVVEFLLLPAKLVGRYEAKNNILGMIPRWSNLSKWSDYRKMDGAYWLTFVTITATFIAGIFGFIVFWLQYLVIDFNVSSGLFNGYIAWMGGASALMGGVLGSHSHVIGITVILGVVAVTAKRFDVLSLGGFRSNLARAGMWVSGIGIIVMTATYIIEGFTQVWPNGPPLLFASDPGGPISLWSFTAANGMAGDDSTMVLASLGAMVMLAPLFLSKIRGKPAWKDPIRLAVLGTWILAYLAVPIEGLIIEFNEATLSGTPLDIVYGQQQYFGLFGIAMVATAFLAVDFFQDRKGARKSVAWFGSVVTTFAVLAGLLYTYLDPGVLATDASLPITTTGWVYTAGLGLISVVLVVAALVVRSGFTEPIAIPVTPAAPIPVPVPTVRASHPANEGG